MLKWKIRPTQLMSLKQLNIILFFCGFFIWLGGKTKAIQQARKQNLKKKTLNRTTFGACKKIQKCHKNTKNNHCFYCRSDFLVLLNHFSCVTVHKSFTDKIYNVNWKNLPNNCVCAALGGRQTSAVDELNHSNERGEGDFI